MNIKHLTNIGHVVYCPARLCDFFGVGAAISYAANAQMTGETNRTNLKIAREANDTARYIHEQDNLFNAQEAEKSREFNSEEAEKSRDFQAREAARARIYNAEEAEKARQWNSEEAVMERRREAGLNVATTGGSVTSSQAAASSSAPAGAAASSSPASASSAPHLSVPTMEAPYFDGAGLMEAVVKGAEMMVGNRLKSSERKLVEKNTEIAQQELEGKTIENDVRRIERANKPYELLLLNTKLKSDIMQGYNNVPVLNALADKYEYETNQLVFQGALAMAEHNLNVQQIMSNYEQFIGTLQFEADKMFAEWKKHAFSLSYNFGITKSDRSLRLSTSTDNVNSGFGVDASLTAGTKIGVLPFPVSGSFAGHFDNSTSKSTGNTFSEESNFIRNFQNTMLMKQASKLKCGVKLLQQAKTKDERLRAISVTSDVLQYINNVLEAHDFIRSRRSLLTPVTPDVFGTDPMQGYPEIH